MIDVDSEVSAVPNVVTVEEMEDKCSDCEISCCGAVCASVDLVCGPHCAVEADGVAVGGSSAIPERSDRCRGRRRRS